jgi:hypothetical protein
MSSGKSHMQSQRIDETLLVKYLLGNLTEGEQVQVEDRAFADVDYLGALEAAETDLIDAYVRGELSQSDRRSFELRFLTSPQRRSKLEFARALAPIVAESKVRESPVARWRSLLSVFRRWTPAFQFAAGIVALIWISGGAWLVFENAAVRSRVVALEAQRRDFEVAEQRLRQQLSKEQSRASSLAAQSQNRQPSEAGPGPLVASLVLLPGLARAQTRIERLVLSPSVQIAHIQIQLESRDDYPRFRAELRTRSGEEVLFRSNLVRRRTGSSYAVSFDVPASALAVGEYELTLKGMATDRASEEVGYYYFGVQKR